MLTIIKQLGLLPLFGKLAIWLIDYVINDRAEARRMQAAVDAGIKRLTQTRHSDVQDISDQWSTIKETKHDAKQQATNQEVNNG